MKNKKAINILSWVLTTAIFVAVIWVWYKMISEFISLF